ncbi:hypothetical protein RFI_16565 [Reticulomyxa filosa]|uniref:Uncharacterized protein n=1 Tax=Reticulomyxa filosa TaxID=46433 RepID=X6N412_RETFI|nr:hypothetical protein RFI_16565 [Reticulomyxa filosa]|eukprot:ETO20653.1 hypothetical protein RFI_16565 [Reticulomyxa filosa]
MECLSKTTKLMSKSVCSKNTLLFLKKWSIKIKTYKKKELEYKIKRLKENDTMSNKKKDRICEDLLDFIGGELGLSGKSRFILVDADNKKDQIKDADDSYKYWNECINGKAESVFLTWKKNIDMVSKSRNNADLKKEDCDKHLEDLMKMMRISPDEECLKDKKGIALKSSDDLKKT